MEELLAILAQLDVEQRRVILEYIKSLLVDNSSGRTMLMAFFFISHVFN